MRKFNRRIWFTFFILSLTVISLGFYFLKQHYELLFIFDNNFTLDQDDPLILKYIRARHLYPPSNENYYLDNPNTDPSWMAHTLTKVFNGKRNGVFVEAGACDGEMISNTLNLEKNYGWTGLLIEPNPIFTERLIRKHRKAWFADVCISPGLFPHKVNILRHTEGDTKLASNFEALAVLDTKINVSMVKGYRNSVSISSKKMSECFPLFSILSASGFLDIDFFNLDVEGLELKILKTIPFGKVNIKVFVVEFNHIPEGFQALKIFMDSKGYYSPFNASRIDVLFIKNGYTLGNIN